MKKQLQHLKLFFPALLLLNASLSHAQQEFTLTTSAANISSAKALIDLPGLTGNMNAIIIATPLGSTKTSNPHPTGAWYYSGKWNIFNCDFAPMPVGMTYKVQYFLNPGANQFLHLVTQQNLGAEGSYIDNAALNNKPNAQFAIFPNHSPEVRAGSWLNPYEAKTGYSSSAGKWYITNINGQLMQKGCAYNIVVSFATGSSSTDPGTNPPVGSCNCPASLPPNGQATGDLAGMYPNPMVTKLLNRPLSNTPPLIGQILKWNGTEWSPSEDLANINNNTGSANVYTPGLGIDITNNEISAAASTPMWNAFQILGRDIMTTAPTVGQVLKWNGGTWAPADDNASSSSSIPLMQTFFKSSASHPSVELSDAAPQHNFTDIKQSVVLGKRSRLIISATITVIGPDCLYGCINGNGDFFMKINNVIDPGSYIFNFSVQKDSRQRQIISNYMIDLDPGTYNIDFFTLHQAGVSPFIALANYSSIIVIPL
jgi:hypothetical protein